MANKKEHCCELNCTKTAEWGIYAKGVPDTAACTKHVGELLTDAKEHRIFPLDLGLSEKDIVDGFEKMCMESINPDLYSCLVDEIIPALKQARKNLKIKDP